MQQIHTGGMSLEAHPLPLLAYMGTALSISRAGDKNFFIRCEDPLMCAGKCLSESAKLTLNRRVQRFAAKALTAAALLSFTVALPTASAAASAAGRTASQPQLPAPLAEAAKRLRINPDDIVISVVPVESPKAALLAWNDRRIDRPASVAKVVTTLAALETLGANYHWYTGFYTLGEPTQKGLLKGGLFIRGGGDPAFVVEDFSMAVDKLAQTGIKRIEGNIVIDRSYFNIPQVDPGAFDGRSSRPYNLQPDPALINYRNLSFEFIPDKETQTARIVTVPKLAGISFPETIPLGRGGCGDWKTSIGFQLKDLGKGRKRVTFTGKLPAACGPKNFNVIALEPNEYLERLFRALWERDGRTWTGHVVSGNVPKDAQRRFSRVSQPLGEVAALTNKWSNNLMARHIFLSLGANRVREAFNEAQKNESSTGKLKSAGKTAQRAELVFPRGATLEDARAALDEWLQSKGITGDMD